MMTTSKDEVHADGSVTQVQEKVYSKEANARMLTEAKKRQAAKMKGYEGDPCPDCGAWTMVRNGSCMKCDLWINDWFIVNINDWLLIRKNNIF